MFEHYTSSLLIEHLLNGHIIKHIVKTNNMGEWNLLEHLSS